MAIPATCSACSASFKVRDELAGKKGKCPRCGAVFRVPGTEQALSGEISTSEMRVIAAQVAQHVPLAPSAPAPVPAAPPPNPSPPLTSGFSAPPVVVAPVVGAPVPGVSAPPSVSVRPSVVPGLALAQTDDHHGRYHRYARSSGVPVWVWGVVAFAVVAGVAGGSVWLLTRPPASPVAANPPVTSSAPTPDRANSTTSTTTPSDNSSLPQFRPDSAASKPATDNFKPMPTRPPSPPKDGATVEERLKFLEWSVVKLENKPAPGVQPTALGTGFVVDVERRLVVTNYHVVADAAEAMAMFRSGVKFGVEGYLALMPHCDLALVQLNGLPPEIQALKLCSDDEPSVGDEVSAVGHPHGASFVHAQGKVSGVLESKDLPKELQDSLKRTQDDRPDNLWIQHNVDVRPGNSGGPLFNARGEVLGVNTFIIPGGELSFSIHARHIRQLLEKPFAKPEPLAKYRRSRVPRPRPDSPPPDSPNQPRQPGPGELAPGIPKPALPAPEQDELKLAYERVRNVGWEPKSSDEYAAAQDLARLYLSAVLAETKHAAEIDLVQRALTGMVWKPQQIKAINAAAVAALPAPGERAATPLLYLGTVAEVHNLGGVAFLRVQLTDTDKHFWVPQAPTLCEALPVGTPVVATGITYGFVPSANEFLVLSRVLKRDAPPPEVQK